MSVESDQHIFQNNKETATSNRWQYNVSFTFQEKTRPGLDWFQDYCKSWSLNPDSACMVVKGLYGYYVIQSSNQQKIKEDVFCLHEM